MSWERGGRKEKRGITGRTWKDASARPCVLEDTGLKVTPLDVPPVYAAATLL